MIKTEQEIKLKINELNEELKLISDYLNTKVINLLWNYYRCRYSNIKKEINYLEKTLKYF